MRATGSLRAGAGPYSQGQGEGEKDPYMQALESPLFTKRFYNSCQCNVAVCAYSFVAIKHENVSSTHVPQWDVVPLQC